MEEDFLGEDDLETKEMLNVNFFFSMESKFWRGFALNLGGHRFFFLVTSLLALFIHFVREQHIECLTQVLMLGLTLGLGVACVDVI